LPARGWRGERAAAPQANPYRRGTMQILDRKCLRAVSCSCYEVIRELESA
jgi:hypothetical protein